MKRNLKMIIATAAAVVMCSAFSSCLSNFKGDQIRKFQEAKGTPEDSVVFYGFLPTNTATEFKQIDKKFPEDIQTGVKVGMFDSSGYWVSTPVKPGSKYMISYMKGAYTSDYVYKWDQKFSEKQQFFVIDIPSEPGLYCFGEYFGYDIMIKAEKGQRTEIFDENYIEEALGKRGPELVKVGLKQTAKVYKGTVWEDCILKELEKRNSK